MTVKRQSRGGHDNRYVRVARVLVEDPNKSNVAVSKEADLRLSTVRYCREAWDAITDVLLKAGWRPGVNRSTLKSSDKVVAVYSPMERELFALLGPKPTSTDELAHLYYRNKAPLNARACVVGALRSLGVKSLKNKEEFSIENSQRNGPHPIKFWVVKNRRLPLENSN